MIKCPKCGDSNCRPTPWRSDAERLEHKRLKAWRCHSCLNRFYHRGDGLLDRIRDNPVVATVGGSTLFVVLTVTVVMVFWGGREMEDRHLADNPGAYEQGVGPRTHVMPRGTLVGRSHYDRKSDDGNPPPENR